MVAALVAMVILVPTAMAQGMMEETTMMDNDMMMQQPQTMDNNMMQQDPKMMQGGMMQQPQMMQKSQMMPNTGGISLQVLLLPAAALLVGTGLVASYVLRRR